MTLRDKPMHIRVIHGPNLNMLGLRETSLYGTSSLEDVDRALSEACANLGCSCECLQSNIEGQIVNWIQESINVEGNGQKIDGLLLNLGAYTHTSIAIRDALLAVAIPFVEVHMSNVFAREPYRHQSFVSDIAIGVITGFGVQSYTLGLRALSEHLRSL